MSKTRDRSSTTAHIQMVPSSLQNDRTDSCSMSSNAGHERGESYHSTGHGQHSDSFASNLVQTKPCSSSSSACNIEESFSTNPLSLSCYPRWPPSAVRLDPCYPIEPTSPECVTLPPPTCQDMHQSFNLGWCNSDGTISFQQIKRFKNSIFLNGSTQKKRTSGSKVSHEVLGNYTNEASGFINPSESQWNHQVSFSCNVHVNLKNVSLRDNDIIHLIDLLEASIFSLLASSSNMPFSSRHSLKGSNRKVQKFEQSTLYNSKSFATEATSTQLKKIVASDVVFFVSLDLSENELTCKGVEQLAKWFINYSQYLRLRILKVYKNYISDNGALALAELIQTQSSALEELHLSHNRIRLIGAEALFKSIGQACFSQKNSQDSRLFVYPRPDRLRQEFLPVWIRLEYNHITDSYGLLQKLEAELRAFRGFDLLWKLVCFADRPNHPHGSKSPHCSPARCLRSTSGHAALLHLYSFYHQSTVPRNSLGVLGQKQERRKEINDNHAGANHGRMEIVSNGTKTNRKNERHGGKSRLRSKHEKSCNKKQEENTLTKPSQANHEQVTHHEKITTPLQASNDNAVTCENMEDNGVHSSQISQPNTSTIYSPPHFIPFQCQPEECPNSSNHTMEPSLINTSSFTQPPYRTSPQPEWQFNARTPEYASKPLSKTLHQDFNYRQSSSSMETCMESSKNIKFLDSAVVSVGSIQKTNDSYQDPSLSFIKKEPCQLQPTLDHCHDRKEPASIHSFQDFLQGIRWFMKDNESSVTHSTLASQNIFSNKKLLQTLPSQKNVYDPSSHSIHYNPCPNKHSKNSSYSQDIIQRLVHTVSGSSNSWKPFPSLKTQQPEQSLKEKLYYAFYQADVKKKNVASLSSSPQQMVSNDILTHADQSTLYIFIDSSAFLSMRKLFTERSPNMFSFPSLAALQKSGAFVAPPSADTKIGLNHHNNVVLIYLDVVKDGVDKMTENTPFLRQSIAEVQDNFVHFLHEARIIQKVKGLGDKTLFPDWATWSQDVFDQAKSLENVAFESLRVFDFACVWQYHLSVLSKFSTNSNLPQPFSIFITGDTKVEKFLTFLSNRPHSKQCDTGNTFQKNNYNLICTHIDRFNTRMLQAFPDLAKALTLPKFFDKTANASFSSNSFHQILSASSIRSMMRQYLNTSLDIALDTTELISSLKKPAGLSYCTNDTSNNSQKTSLESEETQEKVMLHGTQPDIHDACTNESKIETNQIQILVKINQHLISEIYNAYVLVHDILESDRSSEFTSSPMKKSVHLKKPIVQRCVDLCKYWEVLLTQLDSL